MAHHLKQVASQNVKQIQRLILSPQMQQALHLLQLPVLELSSIINDELEQNPILEYIEEEAPPSQNEEVEILKQIDEEFKETFFEGKRGQKMSREEEDLKAFLESSLSYEKSLFDHLMEQARDTFSTPKELQLAELIIGNIDASGFLSSPLEEIALLSEVSTEALTHVLEKIWEFDPPGVGARSLQESLLIQLKNQGKQTSLAYKIVQEHFDDMLNNKIPAIAKGTNASKSKVRATLENEVATLDLHPGANQPGGHYKQIVQYITPDVTITPTESGVSIQVNEESIPPLRINKMYLKMLEDRSLTEETRTYIQEKIASGKWLLRNICERHHTLYRITEEIAHHQRAFLLSTKGQLTPLTMKTVAAKLELHESTIARAVANKYLSCPRGIFPFRSFFTHAYQTESGEMLSSKTVKDLLKELIAQENPHRPLSDEALSKQIQEKGIPCARRTVAKYRHELSIGNTSQRKLYS